MSKLIARNGKNDARSLAFWGAPGSWKRYGGTRGMIVQEVIDLRNELDELKKEVEKLKAREEARRKFDAELDERTMHLERTGPN